MIDTLDGLKSFQYTADLISLTRLWIYRTTMRLLDILLSTSP